MLANQDEKGSLQKTHCRSSTSSRKTLADMWTKKQNKIGLTLPLGARGNGTKTTALNAQGRNAPMTESRLLRSCQGNQRFAS